MARNEPADRSSNAESNNDYPQCPECGYRCGSRTSSTTYKCWTETCWANVINDKGRVTGWYDDLQMDEDTLASIKRAERELHGTGYIVSPAAEVSAHPRMEVRE